MLFQNQNDFKINPELLTRNLELPKLFKDTIGKILEKHLTDKLTALLNNDRIPIAGSDGPVVWNEDFTIIKEPPINNILDAMQSMLYEWWRTYPASPLCFFLNSNAFKRWKEKCKEDNYVVYRKKVTREEAVEGERKIWDGEFMGIWVKELPDLNDHVVLVGSRKDVETTRYKHPSSFLNYLPFNSFEGESYDWDLSDIPSRRDGTERYNPPVAGFTAIYHGDDTLKTYDGPVKMMGNAGDPPDSNLS